MVVLGVQMDAKDIDRTAKTTLVEQVMAAVRTQISSRIIGAGARLPSIRRMADKMQVSKSTVVDAYERLAAEAVIQSRPGSGYYVTKHVPPFTIAPPNTGNDRQVDPVWMTRQSLSANSSQLKPGCGWLPASWMPEAEIRRNLRNLARDQAVNLTDYSPPNGSLELRTLLSRRISSRGIIAEPGQIMLTESGTQAIDLLCRFLLEPGDVVLLDSPSYFNFHALLRAHRVKVIGVPYRQNGPDIALFEQALMQHKPRLYITNSAVHNPTGATLSPATAHRVLKLAERHDLIIIEDDIFADFEHEPSVRLAAFDGIERVVHIGSFSKTLSASLRCGYIVATPDWIEDLVNLKLATSFGGGAFSADLVLSLLKDGAYRRHVSGLRNRLAEAMGKVGAKLKSIGITPWTEPDAGMFLWCQLPAGLDSADVANVAVKHGLILAPGCAFDVGNQASGFMRFNVSQTLDPAIFPILEKSMEMVENKT